MNFMVCPVSITDTMVLGLMADKYIYYVVAVKA